MPRVAAAIEVRPTRDEREREDALRLRHAVFCGEQGVPVALEADGRDGEAIHLVAVAAGRVVGTCRVLVDGSTAKLGRLAVAADAREVGIGGALVEAAEAQARQTGADRVALHAQAHATALYAARGFTSLGEPFDEAGIEHIRMEKRLA
jgi:predicted GNAT family N-acyltransferase